MKLLRATVAAALLAPITAAPARADPVGPCDPQQLTVAAGQRQAGLGHRAVELDFGLQPGAAACQLSGYPTVDAQPQADGSAPVHAQQTARGYLGGASETVVTLVPGHGAQAMLEWVAGGDSRCATYGPGPTDIQLTVTPPGTAQSYPVPISVGRNEGLCYLQVHPVTG